MLKVRCENPQILSPTVQNSVVLASWISASVGMMVPKIQKKFLSLKQHHPEQDLKLPDHIVLHRQWSTRIFFNLPFLDPGVVTHIGPCGLRVGTFLDLSFLVCIFPIS